MPLRFRDDKQRRDEDSTTLAFGRDDGGDGGRPKLKKLRAALVLGGLAFLAVVSWFFGIMMAVAQDLPNLENRAQYAAAENSVIYDVNGERVATLTNNEGRILVASDEIAPTVKEAVVAIEDQRFYDHRGVDYRGIGRAIYQDVLAGSAEQGASTITQQFVKNALEAQQSRTVFQKLREAALAYHLERQWSKDKIITEYLNSIYFGEGAYGIESAAQTFFGAEHDGCGEDAQSTCASQLLPWEAALLAAIISSPETSSPRTNPEAALARRNLVLQKMAEQGSISQDEYQEYVDYPLPRPADIKPPSDDSRAPYFTSWLRQQLVDRYGAGEAFGGGLAITSTLDLELQEQAEGIVDSTLGGIEPTASIVVIDNKTGGVRAMVGGDNYEKAPFNLATNGRRQPGSAFKPFTLVSALEAGRSTSELFVSEPKEIPFEAQVKRKNGTLKEVQDVFSVNNYEDNYLGTVSLATATTFSDNSVYAELGHQVGEKRVAETAERMGIESKIGTNPAVLLGGLAEGVTPLEMAHAYETLAEEGERVSGTMGSSPNGPVGILEVREGEEGTDPKTGDPVEDKTGASGINEPVRKQVVDPAIAKTAVDTLATVVTSGTGKRAQTSEFTWGKTGTTDDNGDAWFVGSTEDITVAVWVGHADSNTPMRTEFGGLPVDGGTFPALIFADVVNAYLALESARGVETETETETTVPTTPAPVAEAPAPVPEAEVVEPEPEPVPEEPAEPPAPAAAPAPPPGPAGGGAEGGIGTGAG